MPHYDLHTAETAPDAAQMLNGIEERMGGLLPNLYRQMAGAPTVLEAYLSMSDIMKRTSFTPAQQQLILLTLSAENGCIYCVAAHSSGARMAKLDKAAIAAVRDGERIEDPALEALRVFTQQLLETRGKVGDGAFEAFLSAGYTRTQAAEIVVAIGMKAISNTFARMTGTPLDPFLEKMAWEGNARV